MTRVTAYLEEDSAAAACCMDFYKDLNVLYFKRSVPKIIFVFLQIKCPIKLVYCTYGVNAVFQ